MRNKSKEIYKGQRVKEKQELFQRFVYSTIKDAYKKKFFELFDNCCFKCGVKEKPYVEIGKPPILCIDHHIPMALGGHLVPGNLVSLCRSCNNKKLDLPPEEFYTEKELFRLKPLLEKQYDIFNFTFNWDYWNKDREGYLLSLGVDPNLVHELFHNKENPDYIGIPSDDNVFTINIDITDVLKSINKR